MPLSLLGQMESVITQEMLKQTAQGQTGATGPQAVEEGGQPTTIIAPSEDTDRMPLRPRPPVSLMPHIPNPKPLELRDNGNFMSHPHPQQPTLPESAVYPKDHKKNSG